MVEFYQNGELLGEIASPPYSFIWNNPEVGVYSLTAKVIDSASHEAFSSGGYPGSGYPGSPVHHSQQPGKQCSGTTPMLRPPSSIPFTLLTLSSATFEVKYSDGTLIPGTFTVEGPAIRYEPINSLSENGCWVVVTIKSGARVRSEKRGRLEASL